MHGYENVRTVGKGSFGRAVLARKVDSGVSGRSGGSSAMSLVRSLTAERDLTRPNAPHGAGIIHHKRGQRLLAGR